ncbi:MAG TPA: class I SAM-dependent methyltransferase [Cytophagales bacterium]|nr:class I SAM-dependent methyltransferase [Cytophagales bacterium]
MDRILQIRRYLYYLLYANDEHQIHSPFVFDFYLNTIVRNEIQPSFQAIEHLRRKMKRSNLKIEVKDYGSGSIRNNKSKRAISTIARNSLKAKKYGRLLYRISKFYNPQVALELGTSLGVTTLYQALPLSQNSYLYTLEGCPETLRIAKENLKSIDRNIKVVEGNIDTTLPDLLKQIKTLDYVFFDANHRLEPTLRYFELCLEKAHENSIFIFDDIHRSKDMDKSWSFIKAHKQVMLTIDLFELGIVLFRKNQPKQHFLLQF